MNSEDILVVVDAGHGGIDSGAVGNGLEEKDLNLKAANYIYKRLQELNIPSVITRTEDEYLPKDKRIERIKQLTNNNSNNILISNHINAGGAEGAEIIYSLKNDSTLSDIILDNLKDQGQIIRKSYQRRLPENPNLDYYYILRETNSYEPILIEYGFIDNKKDAERLSKNIENYAEAVVKSITEYLNYPYNVEISPNEYIVQKGDTLYSIGKRYNVSVDELKKINNLITNDISIGQILKLKETNNNPIYIVQKGDTLYSIAKNNKINIDELIKINNLNSNILSVGQELFIPLSNEEIIDEEYDIYTVKKNDSLWKISQEYNITIPKLIELNNLSDLNIKIGQKLLVPKQLNKTYTVEKGDTIYSISKRFNIPIDDIKKLNNLDSNTIFLGQILNLN